MVARQAVATDPSKAAMEAMNAMKNLAATGPSTLRYNGMFKGHPLGMLIRKT